MAEEVDTQEVTESQEETKTESVKQGKTFDENYVKELRRESAGYRSSLRQAEQERDAALAELEEARGGSKEVSGRVESLESENARLRVALEKGLPADLVPRLVGTTAEELAADADSLLALIGPERKGIHDQGPRQKIEAPDLDTQIVEAERAGNWPLARTLKSQKAYRLANQT